MLQKQKAVVISFDKTVDAMRFDDEHEKGGLPGRLIPLPQEIGSGCGLAWRMKPEEYEEVKAAIDALGVPHKVHTLML
ncbi:MAG: DUF3343 domain-containing protein [Coriobacteriia bacterium]|nr:DUF3343 domain-containing protein [Coriobacteriia bacterium]